MRRANGSSDANNSYGWEANRACVEHGANNSHGAGAQARGQQHPKLRACGRTESFRQLHSNRRTTSINDMEGVRCWQNRFTR
jgi:hypothetical protein